MTTRYANDFSVPVRLGLHESSTLSREKGCIPANIGTRIQLGDRVFRLGTSAVTTVAGQLYCVDTSAAMSAELANFCTAAAAGTNKVTLTGAASGAWAAIATATEDYYAGGYLNISNGAGEGYCYKIKASTAASGTGSDLTSTLTLFDPLAVALTTATDVSIVLNPWKYPIISNTTTDFLPLGVQVGVPATYAAATGVIYSWYQTWGPCAVDSAGTEAAGSILEVGAAGAVAIQNGYDSGPPLGVRLVANTANDDFGPAFLMIHP